MRQGGQTLYAYMYIIIYICIFLCIYIYICFVYIHLYVYIRVYLYLYLSLYMSTSIHTVLCIHIYDYIHINIWNEKYTLNPLQLVHIWADVMSRAYMLCLVQSLESNLGESYTMPLSSLRYPYCT